MGALGSRWPVRAGHGAGPRRRACGALAGLALALLAVGVAPQAEA